MRNRRMKEKLESGECLDVRKIGEPIDGETFRLMFYRDGVDYCDAEAERWIWSIGRSRAEDKIIASVDARFYNNPMFECLWLR